MTKGRAFISTLLMAGMVTTVSAAAQLPAAPNAGAQPPRPLIRLGTKEQELYLTKITVSDIPRSLEFYTRIIGLKLITSTEMAMPKPPAPGDPEKDFVEVSINYSGSLAEPMFVLMKRRGKAPSTEYAGLVTIGFKVPSIEATMAKALQAGFKPARPYTAGQQPAFLLDPDGYSIELMQAPSFPGR